MKRPPKKPKRTSVRGRTPLPATERKDRLVQTRVAEDLDEALRQEARKKRVSVSQLIRNVLEDTFDLVDNIVAETTGLAQAVKRDARRIADSAQGRARAADSASVYAWQEVVLNRDVTCTRCTKPLRKGEKGLFGLSEDPSAPRPWLCRACGAKI